MKLTGRGFEAPHGRRPLGGPGAGSAGSMRASLNCRLEALKPVEVLHAEEDRVCVPIAAA